MAQTPLGSGWSYQGQLKSSGVPLNATADFEFRLWDAAGTNGLQVGSTLAAGNVAVIDGLFTVELDFGFDVFQGDARWLEIAVASPAGGALTTLSPRQPLTGVPYALQTRCLFVDTNGNVGIGTTETADGALNVVGPTVLSGTLDVLVSTLSSFAVLGDPAVGGVKLVAQVRSATAVPQLGFSGAGLPSGTTEIGENAARDFVVEMDDDPKLTVTRTGNVGIGTDTPATQLHVSETGEKAAVAVERTDGKFVELLAGGAFAAIGFDSSNFFSIGPTAMIGDVPAAASSLVVDSAGNVGIGTDSPTTKLEVTGTVTARA